MAIYTFRQLEDKEKIASFWKQSPDATIFTHPDVLPKLVDQVEWWMAYKGEEPVCLWPLCGPDLRNGGISKFVYYAGPIWSNLRLQINTLRWMELTKKIYLGFIDVFSHQRDHFEASFPPTMTDMREFYWMKQDNKYGSSIEIIPRYSAVIKGLDVQDRKTLFSKFHYSRRREINAFKKLDHLVSTQECSVEELYVMYKVYFEQQGKTVPDSEYARIHQLSSLVDSGHGYYYGYRDKATHCLHSIAVVLLGCETANLVINFVDDAYRVHDINASTLYGAILKAKTLNATTFDFNGANSPDRAFYKHSFGAGPVLYFDLKFNQTTNL
jgi:hypothetical protein